MDLIAIWGCFVAVLAGLPVLIWQNWRFYGRTRFVAALLLGWFGLALALGLYAMLNPGLRLPALALPITVVSLTIAFSWVISARRDMRAAAQQATLKDWFGLQLMRAYFGTVIVAGAALGYLPWEFALVAGLGDIAVGIAAAILRRLDHVPQAAAWAFTVFGVIDLLNAGRMGGAVVQPWLLERQLPGFLLFVPIFGVPILLANHLQMVRYLIRQRRANTSAAPAPLKAY